MGLRQRRVPGAPGRAVRRVPEAPGRAELQVLEAGARRAWARRAGAGAAGWQQPRGSGSRRRHCTQRGRLRRRSGRVEHLKGRRASLRVSPGRRDSASVIRLPLTNVPFVDPRSSIVSWSPARRRDPRMTAREPGSSPAGPAGRCAADNELVVERDLRAACLASGYPEPFTSQVAAPVFHSVVLNEVLCVACARVACTCVACARVACTGVARAGVACAGVAFRLWCRSCWCRSCSCPSCCSLAPASASAWGPTLRR